MKNSPRMTLVPIVGRVSSVEACRWVHTGTQRPSEALQYAGKRKKRPRRQLIRRLNKSPKTSSHRLAMVRLKDEPVVSTELGATVRSPLNFRRSAHVVSASWLQVPSRICSICFHEIIKRNTSCRASAQEEDLSSRLHM